MPAPKRKFKGRGVSLTPDMEKSAIKRAASLDLSFSRYIQNLIRADLERNILRAVRVEVT